MHPEGEGSKVGNEELNIAFEPSPDYAGIAVAGSGGKIWGGGAEGWGEVKEKMREAVEKVKNGTGAVLECRLGGGDGAVGEGGRANVEVKGEMGVEVEEGMGRGVKRERDEQDQDQDAMVG